ncbi:MAG: LIV-I protein F [Candidatus Accumulibacter regalis]|jgi:branched-chain amino acid transport system ATP-binding protein|uniref:LIV-I protein F n=1 Tax=Accumulibacter regalis TaxID=522306 RepID=A0A011RIP6_ACCRE|nr:MULTISPECIES: ABC transporter ATP-binding protein [unclassified Candidatus Accumulibacter]EXI91064.1 MAG: LIV-I protein F [Candidatus Accumulibacter regalis]MQM35371.1 ABC transporter ATP-binding protein [Candidatus Accumulibacter phosphatis]MBL8367026.1 ABC transporter ATP-binding protein [Accumulibacter sp.]MBN8513970.1 ABC transporter ATP-binding protein [Accumulibacter sp.]MBO3701766.1 ABC transporter ATP-binding protein [Accumulibacter sp.]
MLEVTGLRVSYGGIQAVRGITFHVNEGEMVALIGANGAGKSSTLRALARLLEPAGGSVRYRGKELVSLPPYQLVGEGIALVPEGRGVFPRMSCLENLRMGAYARNDKAEIERDLEHVLGLFPRLKERAQQTAGTLSGGEQQMLAIGRALMSKPKLMLLDEPSMGLAPIMVQKIFEVIRTVSLEGMTILLVEQNAKLALEVSQRGYVMESGEITVTDESKKLLADPKVRAAYLGE